MRDPDLVVRAQLAASALEGAWHRWRVGYGRLTDPMPAVSSYVGYSLEDPWGQPRVVFGLAAEDAEQLAALLERYDHAKPGYAAVTTQPIVSDPSARPPARPAPLPVPRQVPSAGASKHAGQALTDLVLSGDSSDYDEPVYRQAAAAMKEAAAARELARREKIGAGFAPAPVFADDSDSGSGHLAGSAKLSERSDAANLVSPAWMGSLAMAATTAKAEAEARIRAALTRPREQSTEPSEFDAESGDGVVLADGQVGDDRGADDRGADHCGADDRGADDRGADGDACIGLGNVADVGAEDGRFVDGEEDRTEMPEIYATDVLEPLPTAEEAGADVPGPEEPAGARNQDDEDTGVPDPDPSASDKDASDEDAPGGDANEHDSGDQDSGDRHSGDLNVDVNGHESDDHDITARAPSAGPDGGVSRRGRGTRSYPIARLSKTKRSGASSQTSGS